MKYLIGHCHVKEKIRSILANSTFYLEQKKEKKKKKDDMHTSAFEKHTAD